MNIRTKQKEHLFTIDARNEILTNKELAAAIEDSFGSVSVLLMMNCCMMGIHTQYALRKVVKYLVAPQGMIEAPAYDYIEIINRIYFNNTFISPEELGKNCILSSDSLSLSRQPFADKIEKWSLHCIKLSEADIDEAAKTIGTIAEYLITHNLIQQAKDARVNLFLFDEGLDYFIADVFHFVYELLEIFKKDPDHTNYKNINEQFSILKDIFYNGNIAHVIGRDAYLKSQGTITKYKPAAYSIYFNERVDLGGTTFNQFIAAGDDQCEFIANYPSWLKLLEKIAEIG